MTTQISVLALTRPTLLPYRPDCSPVTDKAKQEEMSGKDREPVFPTRMALGSMQTKLKGAQSGHSLLKRKAEALTKRFREITRRIDEAKRKMGRVMQIAAFSLAEVTYSAGSDVGFQVQESVKNARFKVKAKQENVSGVLLPTFESFKEGENEFTMTGLGRGGQQVQKAREVYTKAVETLVELASLQVGPALQYRTTLT